MKKKEFASFGQWKKHENMKKDVNEASWFGLISGLILMGVCGLHTITSDGPFKLLLMLLTALGLILFFLGGFNAPMLIPLTKRVGKIANLIGRFILKIMLLPVYFVLLIFSLLFKKSTAKKYEFCSWDSVNSDLKTEFLPYEHLPAKPHRSALLGTLNSIFFVFTKNKQYFLIPLVIVLLFLGLVFFFLSSSSVFAFVYTLF